MKMQKVTVEVYSGEKYDDGFSSDSLPDLIAWLQGHLEAIPPEFRDSSRCEIESNSGYEGTSYAAITIKYSRLETVQEYEARVAVEARRADDFRARELALLEALQKKYGKQP